MKTRKQGNALVVTIPSKFGIEENVEYIAVKGDNDSITFIKKKANIFDEAFKNGEVVDVSPGFPEEDEPIGREMI
ncbi:MAG: type II toxin-antitoxin system PemI/MazE family antitoxin [Enterococcus sp.]